jgi:hypothetical protein
MADSENKGSLEGADLEELLGERLNLYQRITRFLKERPLYDRMVIRPGESGELLVYIEEKMLTFDSYCPQCKSDTTWRVLPDPYVPAGTRNRLKLGGQTSDMFEAFRGAVRRLEFSCARNPQHCARFGLGVEVTGEGGKNKVELVKFGQWPSLADIAASEMDAYRSFISETDLAELKRATGLAAHGIGIGSFVYLRRVFERQVRRAADAAIAAGTKLARDEFDRMPMEDKLQAVKDHVPAWMVENRKLYSILSRGLHELSEEVCKRVFPAVKQATLALLEQGAEEARRKKRATEAAAELAKLHESL